MQRQGLEIQDRLALPGLSRKATSQVTDLSLLRVSRPVAACLRCRNASQRCDGKRPACTNCKISGYEAQCAASSRLLAGSEGTNLRPTASAPGPDTTSGITQNGLTARVGNMALSINWQVSYEKGEAGTAGSSWLQYVVSIDCTSSGLYYLLTILQPGIEILAFPVFLSGS